MFGKIEKSRCYEFGMPEVLAGSLKGIRFNVLSLDNNHSEDYGAKGYQFTHQTLNELEIKFSPKTGFTEFVIAAKQLCLWHSVILKNHLTFQTLRKCKKDY